MFNFFANALRRLFTEKPTQGELLLRHDILDINAMVEEFPTLRHHTSACGNGAGSVNNVTAINRAQSATVARPTAWHSPRF
jgi:hypothetical protein